MTNPVTETSSKLLPLDPFGMITYGRSYSSGAQYRFGFNGYENIDEFLSDNIAIDFVERIFDSRLGRFLSIDQLAKEYPWQTPYAYYSNSPIRTVDALGLGDPTIVYGANANQSTVPESSKNVLTDIAKTAGVQSVTITSTTRSPEDQARAMYNNLVSKGTASQYNLYGPSGDKVIDVYSSMSKTTASPQEIKESMTDKINEVGPANVSKHCGDPNKLTVVDIAPSSIPEDKRDEFIAAVQKAVDEGKVSKFLYPGNSNDPAYHIEIPVISTANANDVETKSNKPSMPFIPLTLEYIAPADPIDNTYLRIPYFILPADSYKTYDEELEYFQ